MDPSLVAAIATALSTAQKLLSGAVKLRDNNLIGQAVADANDQLLKAQQDLFTHNAEMMKLQQEHFEVREQLQRMKAANAERDRYSLQELDKGVFAYGLKAPEAGEPLHYLCQPCFDKGTKSVLQDRDNFGAVTLKCPVCQNEYRSGRKKPYPRLSPSLAG